MSHAPLPSLCDACQAEALADAGCPGAYVVRHCEHREATAIGYKRGAEAVVAWELHSIPNLAEVPRIAETIVEMYFSGLLCMRRVDLRYRGSRS